jgi:UDP-GlcNAc:undecaprenyl-phosphate/decaprenyl-phosphate GlcNAc-1-phosphate transferase
LRCGETAGEGRDSISFSKRGLIPPLLTSSLGVFVLAALASALLTPAARAIGRRAGLYATPTDDRWHRVPIPATGGPALFAALVISIVGSGHGWPLWPLFLSTLVMFASGLVDDVRAIGPAAKLVCQVVGAALLLYFAPALDMTGSPVLDLVLALLWMVGITNAFNLLDNIDGLAAGVAAIVGAFACATFALDGGGALHPLVVAAAALVGTSVGFLLYNFQPASIFMGDSGSQFLGSFIAGLTLVAAPAMKTHVVPVAFVPVVLLLIPIFDTTFVTLTRRLAGRSAFVGGRDHTSHRLVALGIGERRAVVVLYALATLGGFVALGLRVLPLPIAVALVVLYVVLLTALGVYLGHIRTSRSGGDDAPEHLLPTELTNRYRVIEVLLDTVLVATSYYLAFSVRFRGPEFAHFLPYFTRSLPIVVCIQLSALWASGKYRQVWRTLGPTELMNLLWGFSVGVGASVITVLYVYRFEGYSRSVFAFDAVMLVVLIGGARVGVAALDDYLRQRRSRGRIALVYGAGMGGALAVRELLQNHELGMRPVGFIDDDPGKRRLRVDGVPVLGTIDRLEEILREEQVATLVVSIRDLSLERLERACQVCEARGVDVRRMRFAIDEVSRTQRASVVRFPSP